MCRYVPVKQLFYSILKLIQKIVVVNDCDETYKGLKYFATVVKEVIKLKVIVIKPIQGNLSTSIMFFNCLNYEPCE